MKGSSLFPFPFIFGQVHIPRNAETAPCSSFSSKWPSKLYGNKGSMSVDTPSMDGNRLAVCEQCVQEGVDAAQTEVQW